MPPHSDIDGAKQRVRAKLTVACRDVSSLAATRAGEASAVALERDERWRASRRIGLFATTRGEPDTLPIFEAALRAGHEILLPRCPTSSTMEFAAVASWDELRPGRYGLLEPTSEVVRDAWRSGDVVIVPGLAFDRRGGRLGRGGGHYDRCFGVTPVGAPWLIALGFSFQIVREVPMDRHDRRLDGVLAEGELVWCEGDSNAGPVGNEPAAPRRDAGER